MPTLPARFKLAYENFALDVDLQLPSTGVTVLFGPSGSGKTTLLRCIAGLDKYIADAIANHEAQLHNND